jgi:hypothetical protein
MQQLMTLLTRSRKKVDHLITRKIRLIEDNTKCRKKMACKGTLRQMFIRVYRLEIASFLSTVSHVAISDPAL